MKRLLAACGITLMLAMGPVAAMAAPAGGATIRPAAAVEATPAAAHTPADAAHTPAAPAHGVAHEVDPVAANLNLGEFIATIVIFITLLVVLRAVAWKPILAGLKNREAAIRDSIEAAQRAKNDAERTTKELETKMAEVQRQAAAALTQAKADALKLAESIRAQAETESAALKDRTLREIDAAKQEALAEINAHGAELGTAVARKILQRNITAEDQQRLVDESLAEMAQKN